MPPKPTAVGKKSAMKRIRSGELACRADGLEVGRGVCRSMAPLWWATETPTPRKESGVINPSTGTEQGQGTHHETNSQPRSCETSPFVRH